MLRSLIPRFLLPDFTWPDSNIGAVPSDKLPPIPQPASPLVQRFWGFVHHYLRRFSVMYCRWVGIEFDWIMAELPFGLILKSSQDGRVEEALNMQVARKAGLPVPKVICYGIRPHCPLKPFTMLITRPRGEKFGKVYETLSDDEKYSVLEQVKIYLEAMRSWKNPWGKDRICSISGTAIQTCRIPRNIMGPFESEQEMNDYLISPAFPGDFESETEYNGYLDRAKKMHELSHDIVFTHGHLDQYDIIVHKGRVSGLMRWRHAGWYPEYWEFTTALRLSREDFWWYKFMMGVGADKYKSQLDFDRALLSLTSCTF